MSSHAERANRLAGESSPYLLLHAHNPVDWHPWGDEALARARDEDRPIFLSIGYSTCYWCHVMERESFSDPAIAELMNRDFVNIKIDREERPDLDEIYMTATQLFSGHGGWPNSVFLTPGLEPFFAGTYFPPADRQGLPGFPTVVRSLANAWRDRRDEVDQQAAGLAESMRRVLEERAGAAASVPGPECLDRAVADLAAGFDPRWGGFGGAPKFPTPSNLLLLLEVAGTSPRAAEMLEVTLDRMARGGIYDQIGGGFHRYATDGEWKIPHFEKMLYDNGLLLEVYAREWERSADPEAARVVRRTAAFLQRELTAPEGAFWSALDAETEGREGAFYAWSREALKTALGEEGFGFLAPIYGFDGPPFFDGEYVLHLPGPLAEQAKRRRTTVEALGAELDTLAGKLFAARSRRQRPLTDDKILTDWNGTAIAGLATAGRVLPDPALTERAAAAARFLLATLRPEGGPLHHSWRAGRLGPEAFLSDYAFLIHGLLALERAGRDEGWLATAVELAEEQERRLGADVGGYYVAAPRDDVLFRSQEVFDGAMPGANGVAALNLVALADRTGEPRWAERAERTLRAFGAWLDRHPAAVRTLAVAASRYARSAAARPEPAPADAVAKPSPGAPRSAVDEARAKLETSLELEAPAADGWRGFELELTIAPGWHLDPHAAPSETGAATRLEGLGLELRDVAYPRGVERRLAGEPRDRRLYEGRVVLRGELRVVDADGGRLVLHFQPCGERSCLAPASFEIAVQ